MSSESLQPLAHLLQLLLWAAYFTLHSLLASPTAKLAFARRFPHRAARYPFYYSVLAAALLLPVASLVTAVPGPSLWHWVGPFAWCADSLAVVAFATACYAGRSYQLARFLGRDEPAARPPPLVISPVHRYVRHPWYACGLVILWTRDMDLATFLSALSITAYLVIGARLEDAKLIAAYGDAYRKYMARIPGLWPRPGRRLTSAEATTLLGEANAYAAACGTAPRTGAGRC